MARKYLKPKYGWIKLFSYLKVVVVLICKSTCRMFSFIIGIVLFLFRSSLFLSLSKLLYHEIQVTGKHALVSRMRQSMALCCSLWFYFSFGLIPCCPINETIF